MLSEHLHDARSTIYRYFKNKEEIVAACMKRAMERTIIKISEIEETHTMVALQQILLVFTNESNLHLIVCDARKINTLNSVSAKKDIEYVHLAHQSLKLQLNRLFENAQKEGKLRSDIPLLVLLGVFFTLIDTPNLMKIPSEQW